MESGRVGSSRGQFKKVSPRAADRFRSLVAPSSEVEQGEVYLYVQIIKQVRIDLRDGRL